MTPLLKMLAEITERAEKGEIIAGAFQYIKSDGSMWLRSVDGELKIPQDMMDDAAANYSRLTGKGN